MKDNKDVDSLSHMMWRYQYHAVFAPTIEAEVCPDHIHMLISFPSKYSISYVMGYLKEKSTLLRLTQAIGLASGFRLLF